MRPRLLTAALAGAALAAMLVPAAQAEGGRPPFRIGFAKQTVDPRPAEVARRGITAGCGFDPAANQPTYCPDNAVTRGQMVLFLVRTFNR